jgi:hypothetical protein
MGATDDSRLDEIINMLRSLNGVKKAFYLDAEARDILARTESEVQAFGPLVVKNQGVVECLERRHVACIVKDKSFRPPPHATVILIDEDGNIIGRELLPGEEIEEEEGRKTLYLGKDFVMFYDGGRSGRNARFVLPPVPFAEVEALPFVESVCSSSPSTRGDLMIRKREGLDDDPKLATVLIGFDLRKD